MKAFCQPELFFNNGNKINYLKSVRRKNKSEYIFEIFQDYNFKAEESSVIEKRKNI